MVQVSPIWFHLEPECALEGPGRPIRVPGEFQEVTVSAIPPNQRQPLVTPLPAPHHGRARHAPAPRPASRRTIRPNLNAKRVNTVIPASENHRASEYALQSRKMAIAVADEFQESEGPCTNWALRAVCGRSLIFSNLPANHRASECAL